MARGNAVVKPSGFLGAAERGDALILNEATASRQPHTKIPNKLIANAVYQPMSELICKSDSIS
jgi:hypothetical protein